MSAQGNVTQVYAVPGLPVLLPDGLNRHITLGALVVSSWASVFTGGVVLACGMSFARRAELRVDPHLFSLVLMTITRLCLLHSLPERQACHQGSSRRMSVAEFHRHDRRVGLGV